MSKKKRTYEVEFKIDAAKLVGDQGYMIKETVDCLGVPFENLTRWLRQYRNGQLVSGQKQAKPTSDEAGIRELESKKKRLGQEVAILKKAASYFAKQML